MSSNWFPRTKANNRQDTPQHHQLDVGQLDFSHERSITDRNNQPRIELNFLRNVRR